MVLTQASLQQHFVVTSVIEEFNYFEYAPSFLRKQVAKFALCAFLVRTFLLSDLSENPEVWGRIKLLFGVSRGESWGVRLVISLHAAPSTATNSSIALTLHL